MGGLQWRTHMVGRSWIRPNSLAASVTPANRKRIIAAARTCDMSGQPRDDLLIATVELLLSEARLEAVRETAASVRVALEEKHDT